MIQATLATTSLIDNAPIQAQLVENPLCFQADGCEFSNDSEIIADWLYSKATSTAKAYFSVIKQISSFSGGMAIAQWTKKLVIAFLESCKQAQKTATINKKLSAIRSLLNHCVSEGYITRNVASNVKKFKEPKNNVERGSNV